MAGAFVLRVPRVIANAARDFIEDVRVDPRFALELSLPEGLDLPALQEVRPVVYALLHALDFTLDEATPIIGLLVEIDRPLPRWTLALT